MHAPTSCEGAWLVSDICTGGRSVQTGARSTQCMYRHHVNKHTGTTVLADESCMHRGD